MPVTTNDFWEGYMVGAISAAMALAMLAAVW
jgi:hypothetical protein